LEVEATPPRPARTADAEAAPRSHRRWRSILSLVTGLLLFWLLDAAVFGSGLYLRWASPDSGLGDLLNVMRATEHAPDVKGGILVFGNSRMAEGFSAKLADAEAARLGAPQKFFNSAVPGTSARVWYYMLRAYRDRGLHPAAVVFAADSLHDGPGNSDPDAVSSIAFLPPFLGLRDIVTFPLSFKSPAARIEALEAVLFKGWLLHGDVEDFLERPTLRIKNVELWREHGADWIYDYPGNSHSLTGLSLDLATGQVGWGAGADELPNGVRKYIAKLKEKRGDEASPVFADFTREWYGGAAELCRQMGARLIVFRVPRGPLQVLAAPQGDAHGALADLAAAGDLTLIQPDTFDDFERPQFFFDELHMNHVGREAFSPRLARETLQILAH
jgi:hypothetical protein